MITALDHIERCVDSNHVRLRESEKQAQKDYHPRDELVANIYDPLFAFHPKGALHTGDTRLLQSSHEIPREQLESVDGEINDLIVEMENKLHALPYFGLTAPQFGKPVRLIVMYGTTSRTNEGIENIPFQVWANPILRPIETLPQLVPRFEIYATNPSQSYLVSSYASVSVSGYYRDKSSPEFRFIENRTMDGWHARCMQALVYYLHGRPPQERLLHTAFTMPRTDWLDHWRGRVPFRLRGLQTTGEITLDIEPQLFAKIDSVVQSVLKSHSNSENYLDILGFIKFHDSFTVRDEDCELLYSLLSESLTNPQWFVEMPRGDDCLVRLFRLDLPNPACIDLDSSSWKPEGADVAETTEANNLSAVSLPNPISRRSSPASLGDGGTSGSPKPMPPKIHQWQPCLSYYDDLRALTFATATDIEAAIDLLWTPALVNAPHDLVGSNTVIVPVEAVPYFDEAGLRFTSDDVESMSDLPPSERAKLRREQGIF